MNRFLVGLLALSLVANVLLAVRAVRPAAKVPAEARVGGAPSSPLPSPIKGDVVSTRPTKAAISDRLGVGSVWRPAPDAENARLIRLRESLTSAGYSPRVVYLTIKALRHNNINAHMREILGPERMKAMQRGDSSQISPEEQVTMDEMVRAQSAQLPLVIPDELLYAATLDDPRMQLFWERSLRGSIAWDRYAELRLAELDFNRLVSSALSDPSLTKSERRALADLANKEMSKIEKEFLTEDEQAELEMRYAGTGWLTALNVSEDDLSEAEFRRLFLIERAKKKQRNAKAP